MARSFRTLRAWQLAIKLAEAVFDVTDDCPTSQRKLVNAMRDAAVNVPMTIADGAERDDHEQFIDRLSVAYLWICELDLLLTAAVTTGLLNAAAEERVGDLADAVADQIDRLHASLSDKGIIPLPFDA